MVHKHLEPLTRRERASSILWSVAAILFGWSLFIYWWARVISIDHARALLHSVVYLGICCIVFAAATLIWIWHNIRIARRGKRGFSTRYHVPSFLHDGIGREISMPGDDALQRARITTVHATPDKKIYSAEKRAS